MKDLRQYFTSPGQISLPGRSDANENDAADVHNLSVQSGEEYMSSDSAPYVVRSLEDAIHLVLADNIFKQALTDSDEAFLSRFCRLSEPAKLICSRLFGRVQTIFRKTDLSRIVETNLDEHMSELVSAGLFSTTIDCVQCDTILKALNRQELQNLSSRYNIKNYKKLKMSELIVTLLKLSTGSASNSFFGKDLCPEARFRKHLRQVLGTCWCIDLKRMRLLCGVLWLSGMGSDTTFGSPQRSKTIESQLKTEFYHMLLVRRGEIVYPSFQITKKTVVYRSPDELKQYLDFFDCQLKMEYTVAEKQFDTATEIFNSMRNHLLRLVTDPCHVRTDLAGFLRRFTLPYRAFRILLIGIDLLERQKRYQDAVTLMRQVLFPDVGDYCAKTSGASASGSCPLDNLGPCRVGRLLVRLLVDQGSHLKQPELALDAVRKFLRIGKDMKSGISACPCIRAGLRLELHEQLSRTADILPGLKQLPDSRKDVGIKPPKRRRSIVSSAEKENSDCELSLVHIPDLVSGLLQAPKVEIRAPVNASSKDLGAHRPHYLWFENSSSQPLPDESSTFSRSNQEDDTDTFLLTVEQWTLRYYTSRLGFERGLHSESRIFHLIFVLLFYDILFDDTIPDVFYTVRQTEPLDLCTDDFYASRRSSIDERLSWILKAEFPLDPTLETEPVGQKIADCWTAHFGERCIGASWDLLPNPQEVSDLFWCLGPKVVHAVCRQLSTDYRSWRSGIPDLVVWSPSTQHAKIVEVKGPGDHLSTQQVMWLDVLMRAGADVEICHVVAISPKLLHG